MLPVVAGLEVGVAEAGDTLRLPGLQAAMTSVTAITAAARTRVIPLTFDHPHVSVGPT